MKVVIIDWIHNRNWMTTKLVDEFVRWVKSVNENAEIVHYDLMKEDIKPCMWCGKCTEDQKSEIWKCMIDDKWTEIIENALEADVLVFATPIYEYCVSSTMKRFLERCLPLWKFSFGIVARRKANKNKKWVILCSSWAPFPFNYLMWIAIYPRFILRLSCKFFGCWKIKSIFAWLMAGSEKMKNKYMKKAFKLWQSM